MTIIGRKLGTVVEYLVSFDGRRAEFLSSSHREEVGSHHSQKVCLRVSSSFQFYPFVFLYDL